MKRATGTGKDFLLSKKAFRMVIVMAMVMVAVLMMACAAGAAQAEQVGHYPAIGIESKGDWQQAFYEDFEQGAKKGTWHIEGEAQGGEGLLLLENASIQSKRSFSAEDMRFAFMLSGEPLPMIELVDENGIVILGISQIDGVLKFANQEAAIQGEAISNGACLELLLENDLAMLSLLDGNGDILWQTEALSLTYEMFYVKLSAPGRAAGLASIGVDMRAYIYMSNVIGSIDEGMQDGTWTLPLYTPPAPYEGEPVSLYHGPGSVTGGTRYDQAGFFLRPGVAGKPDILSIFSDGMDAEQYTAVNSMNFNKGIPMGDHNIVITFEAFRSEVTGGMVSVTFMPAGGGAPMGQLDMVGASDVRVYRHLGAHNIATQWVDADGNPIVFENTWLRFRVEISPETLTLSVQRATGARAGETICSVTDTFYGGPMVMGIMTANAKSMINLRNFMIEGIPAPRSGEVLLPEYPEGTETVGNSELMWPVIDFLEGENGLDWLNPANNGSYIEDQLVPDTLDLAARGEMAARGLTNFLDGATLDGSPETGISYGDFAPYGQSIYCANIANMSSYPSGGQMAGSGRPNWGKITEATIMARVMSGSQYRLDVQQKSLTNALRYTIGDESYSSRMLAVNQMGEYAYAVGPLARIMMTLESLYEVNPDADPKEREALRILLDEIAQAQMHNAVYQWELDEETGEKVCVYGANLTSARSNTYNSAGNLGYMDINLIDGNSIRALARWGAMGETAKQEVIEEISRLFKNLFMLSGQETGYYIYTPDHEPKAMTAEDHAAFDGHIHAAMLGLIGLCEYGIYMNDVEVLEFVRSGYEYVRNFGIAAVGLFGETCTVGEMTALAVMLSRAGVGDYWDDVDRYVRNALAETQLTDENIGLFAEVLATMPGPEGITPYNQQTFSEGTTVQALERVIGTFLTDATHLTHVSSMRGVICCTGNAMQGLYYAWEGIVTEDNGVISINLPLNRSSKWVDIDSYVPYEGKLVLHIKEAESVLVRIPNYAALSDVQVDGSSDGLLFIGRNLVINNVQPGQSIVISFPIEVWTESHYCMWSNGDQWHKEGTDPGKAPGWVNHDPALYDILFKGNTVIAISPLNQAARATGYKLYQGREAILTATETPMKTMTRYVPEYTIRQDLYRLDQSGELKGLGDGAASQMPAGNEALQSAGDDGPNDIREILDKLIKEDDMAYLVDSDFDDGQTPGGIYGYGDTIDINASALRRLIDEMKSNDEAAEAARLIKAYLLQEKFWQPEALAPAISGYERGRFTGHMPSYSKALLALAEYAKETNDMALMGFVRAGYEHIRCYGLSGMGLYGETCTTGYMVCIAIELTNMGMGDYWDDVERAVRNGLLPRQREDGKFYANSNDPWAYLTDQTVLDCCTEASTEALSAVLANGVASKDGGLLVQMLFDMDTPEITLSGGWANQGEIAITMHQGNTLALRMPLYIEKSTLKVNVNDVSKMPAIQGNKLMLFDLEPGDMVYITYGMAARTEEAGLKWHKDGPIINCTDPGQDWAPTNRQIEMRFEGNLVVECTEK